MRTKRRRKFFLEVMEQALKAKVQQLKNADLSKWNEAEDKRIKEVRDRRAELEKKRKEQEEQLNQPEKQQEDPKKKQEEPKKIVVPKSEEELKLEGELKRRTPPVYQEPSFIVRNFQDAKDKNFKFVNGMLMARLRHFVKETGPLTVKSLSQEIVDELKQVNTKTPLPKLPEAPLAEGLGLTEWPQLQKLTPEVLSTSLEELIELDVATVWEFLVAMGYDLHLNKMHALSVPPNLRRFSARKLQLLRHLVEDRMCRETKSVFGLRGKDFFLASKSRGFDWENDP